MRRDPVVVRRVQHAARGWRRVDGATKAMSARVALNKMAADGLIVLPAPRNSNGNGRHLRTPRPTPHRRCTPT